MTRRLLISYLSLTVVVLITLAVPLGVTHVRSERQVLLANTAHDATVLASLVEPAVRTGEVAGVPGVANEYAERVGARVVVVDDTGLSIADTDNPDLPPRVFSTRPEFQEALSGRIDTGTRPSETLGHDLAFAATPVASGGTVYGALRITLPAGTLAETARRTWLVLGLASVVVLGVVVLVAWLLARSVTRPIRRLEAAAAGLSAGDLTRRAEITRAPPEVQALAGAFNDMAARLESLIGSQKAFVSDASHQLRTPLTALRLQLENAAAAAREEERDDLEAAVAETERLTGIVNGLLALSRADGSEINPEPVDVGRVLEGRRRFWEPVAAARDVALELDCPDAAVADLAPGHLEQMVDNLVANALDVAPRDSRIIISAAWHGDRIIVKVVDQGPGLDDEGLQRAFDRFWQGRSGKGTGLGLAIVAQLAEVNAGSATLRRAPPGGLEAVLDLPAGQDS